MLQTTVIGNVGADAVKKSKDGREFWTFRVAHNDSWTDQAGQQHSNTIWVDCILNKDSKVAEFIKAGTQVYITGRTNLRVYSSEKDRCMKAGLTISVDTIQLLGGQTDDVPRKLYDKDGVQHDVSKWYLTDVKATQLMSQRGQWYNVDDHGWVLPVKTEQQEAAQQGTENNSQQNADGSPSEIY